MLNIKPGAGALSDELLTSAVHASGPLKQIVLSVFGNAKGARVFCPSHSRDISCVVCPEYMTVNTCLQ